MVLPRYCIAGYLHGVLIFAIFRESTNLVKINSYESSGTNVHVFGAVCHVSNMSLYRFFKPVNKKLPDSNGELSATISHL